MLRAQSKRCGNFVQGAAAEGDPYAMINLGYMHFQGYDDCRCRSASAGKCAHKRFFNMDPG